MSERKAYVSMPRHNGERFAKLMVEQYKQMNATLDNVGKSELLPCPLCGGEARIEHGLVAWAVVCPCSSHVFYGCELDKAKTAEAWNARAERTCHVVSTYRYDYEGGYAGFEYVTELSCGHRFKDGNGDSPDYCPWCGAKVVER